jgi:hypothetical protein
LGEPFYFLLVIGITPNLNSFLEEKMKQRLTLFVLIVLLSAMILTACGAAAPAATEAPVMEELFAPATEAPAFYAEPAQPGSDSKAGEAPAALPTAGVYDPNILPADPNLAPNAARLIIKNAEVRLLVEDTDVAIDRTTQIVGDMGGYIISSRVWYQDWFDGESYSNFKYATITIGVPVEQFERTLSRLRGLAIRVLDETASGEDVTDQFVDLQSQLTNLEATRERIKTFLDQAQTVDEALRINAELAEIERQIEEIKGRMNYLSDRSAYSTITVNFEPEIPEITPTPTPTPTPVSWNPGETFEDAKKTVTNAYQGIVDFLIWIFVVFVPIFAPPVLIVWGVWRLVRRKSK